MNSLIDKYGQDLTAMSTWAAKRYNLDPDDVHQDMVLSLLEGGHTAQTIAAKGGTKYLRTVSRNRAHNLKRKTNRLEVVDMSEGGADGALGTFLTATTDGSISNPQLELDHKYTLATIQVHINRIVRESGEHQRILNLYYLQGLGLEDVAKTMGLPPNKKAASWHLSKARAFIGEAQADLKLWRAYAHPEASGSTRPPARGTEKLQGLVQL